MSLNLLRRWVINYDTVPGMTNNRIRPTTFFEGQIWLDPDNLSFNVQDENGDWLKWFDGATLANAYIQGGNNFNGDDGIFGLNSYSNLAIKTNDLDRLIIDKDGNIFTPGNWLLYQADDTISFADFRVSIANEGSMSIADGNAYIYSDGSARFTSNYTITNLEGDGTFYVTRNLLGVSYIEDNFLYLGASMNDGQPGGIAFGSFDNSYALSWSFYNSSPDFFGLLKDTDPIIVWDDSNEILSVGNNFKFGIYTENISPSNPVTPVRWVQVYASDGNAYQMPMYQ